MLEIKQRRVKTIIFLEISGTLDIDSANFIERIGAVLQNGYRDIICDMKGVNLVDYSGLSALALAYKDVANHKGRMAFINVPQHVARTFNLVCLDRIFEIYPDEEAALKNLRHRGSSRIFRKGNCDAGSNA